MTPWVIGLTLLVAGVAWADTADDLKSCQAQIATASMQAQQARQERAAYVIQLAEMLAETRSQLLDARAQLDAVRRDVTRRPPSIPNELPPKPDAPSR
jgi:outer membrane protein TolC